MTHLLRVQDLSEAITAGVIKFSAVLRHAQTSIMNWVRRRATYRELRSLDDRTLADIGLTRYDVEAFANGTGELPSRVADIAALPIGASAVVDFPSKTMPDHRANPVTARDTDDMPDPRRAA
jgi:uncharacterized protein YjiS (DUF1127 family)